MTCYKLVITISSTQPENTVESLNEQLINRIKVTRAWNHIHRCDIYLKMMEERQQIKRETGRVLPRDFMDRLHELRRRIMEYETQEGFINITMTADYTLWKDQWGRLQDSVDHEQGPDTKVVMTAHYTAWKSMNGRVQDRIVYKYVGKA